jgi:hypothetical protein
MSKGRGRISHLDKENEPEGANLNCSITFKPAAFHATLSLLFLMVASSQLLPSTHGKVSQTREADKPYVVEYYYKAKWGYADEFISLFKKNHFPVLQKQIETGRMLKVTAVKPRYHTTEEGRWDYRVTIVFKNLAAAHDSTSEEVLIKQLYPDQIKFKREEQRRFEILLAHWDVPLVDLELDK